MPRSRAALIQYGNPRKEGRIFKKSNTTRTMHRDIKELQRWERVKAECEASIDRHGAILEAVTDRGKPVLRKNPAMEALKQANAEIEKLRKIVGDAVNLD